MQESEKWTEVGMKKLYYDYNELNSLPIFYQN